MNISREQFLEFIKKKKERDLPEEKLSKATKYYLKIFDLKGNKKFFRAWNWDACAFQGAWMMYRRMYLYSFLSMFLFIFTVMILVTLGLTIKNVVASIIFLALSVLLFLSTFIIFGMYGTSLYIYFAQKKIEKGKTHLSPKIWPVILLNLFFMFIGVDKMFSKILDIIVK